MKSSKHVFAYFKFGHGKGRQKTTIIEELGLSRQEGFAKKGGCHCLWRDFTHVLHGLRPPFDITSVILREPPAPNCKNVILAPGDNQHVSESDLLQLFRAQHQPTLFSGKKTKRLTCYVSPVGIQLRHDVRENDAHGGLPVLL